MDRVLDVQRTRRDDQVMSPAVLTFLIADLRDYTPFTLEQGDEAAARLVGRFAELAAEVVDRYDGRVVELRGDEALCAFPSVRNALRAAVALQTRCSQATSSDPSLPLHVGIGLDSGEAVPVAGGYRGAALNLAARLCSMAGRGEVLVSETVSKL
jgi:class 3 adenylate cyclase